MRTRKFRQAPLTDPDVVSPELRAWAQMVDVSRLSAQTAAAAESYLTRHRRMPWFARRELTARLVSVVAAEVRPPPPPGAAPLDILAIVLAVRREHGQPGGAARSGSPRR